jgi:hypothetical protein
MVLNAYFKLSTNIKRCKENFVEKIHDNFREILPVKAKKKSYKNLNLTFKVLVDVGDVAHDALPVRSF